MGSYSVSKFHAPITTAIPVSSFVNRHDPSVKKPLSPGITPRIDLVTLNQIELANRKIVQFSDSLLASKFLGQRQPLFANPQRQLVLSSIW